LEIGGVRLLALRAKIRHPSFRVVNDREAFMDAVDVWIEKNLSHHLQTAELATAMNAAFTRYMAAASEVLGSKGSAPGN
jgi:hypothetical protein